MPSSPSSAPLGANVLVTGANRGIGLGIVKEILKTDGIVNLFAGCRNPSQAEELKELTKCHQILKLVKIDVSCDESIANAVVEVRKMLNSEEEKGLHTLINNAGILEKEGGTLLAPDRAAYLRHFNVNVVGTVATTAAFLPLLRKAAATNSCQKEQQAAPVVRVVNIGGALGCIGKVFLKPSECPYQNMAYGMSKAAVHHFNKMFSIDQPDFVSVAIHPGWLATDMGGTTAPETVEERIPQVIRLIGTLTMADSGKLMDHEKEIEP
ncbi:hypothetical protein niasHT_008156 [Heterodera trifolii]|uniref:Uncharacterized protein n=1 Tax=Heterodera trifolii TaxID=157864 RepID=A0ABD2M360_9BILA